MLTRREAAVAVVKLNTILKEVETLVTKNNRLTVELETALEEKDGLEGELQSVTTENEELQEKYGDLLLLVESKEPERERRWLQHELKQNRLEQLTFEYNRTIIHPVEFIREDNPFEPVL
jgi:FtsZ-binding cell division protein ZapB